MVPLCRERCNGLDDTLTITCARVKSELEQNGYRSLYASSGYQWSNHEELSGLRDNF